MRNSTPLELVESNRAASAAGFTGGVLLVVVFAVLGEYLWALVPLGLACYWFDGMFRRRVVTFYAVNKTVTVMESSLWRRCPETRVLPWRDVADVIVEGRPSPRGARRYRIFMLLRDKSRVALTAVCRRKRALALQRKVARLVGVM